MELMSTMSQRSRLALGVTAAALIAGSAGCGAVAPRPALAPSDRPGSIYNLVLQAGPAVAAQGNNYPGMATRGQDPSPLSTGELAAVFPPGRGGGPEEVSTDCAGAVTGQPVTRALQAAGCGQVLRLIATSTGTGGPYTGLIDIFNLASGAAAYQAARAFGEESPNGSGPNPLVPPNATPGGFILPWPGTAAAGVARAPGNAADVDAFGHFLVVLWTYGHGGATANDSGPQLANGLFELHLDQFAGNRAARDSAG
jgi:hypothetical protein